MKIPKILHDLLALRRPSGGRGVQRAKDMILEFITNSDHVVVEDLDGNIICTTKFNGVLFSSHTDTVHDRDGSNEIRMDDFGHITAWRKYLDCDENGTQEKIKRDVLGADDAAGIYIMLRMIEESIPGTYVFHADEEIGCVGSRKLADIPYSIDGYDLEEDFTHAIAFDRKGTNHLIWKQISERMCSDECVDELMDRLNLGTILDYRSVEGMVTDTAMYGDLVPECINLSVGYYNEHTDEEYLDFVHVENLIEVILSPERDVFHKLPAVRVPWLDQEAIDIQKEYDIVRPETIAHLCHTHPDAIAHLLETFGYDYPELFSVLNKQELI